MNTCPECGVEFSNTTEKKYRFCPDCRQLMASQTWKRQMRAYGIAMAVGLALVLIAYSQFKGGSFTIDQAPMLLLLILVAGGLGLMGGLFGFALALFFSIWHRKSN